MKANRPCRQCKRPYNHEMFRTCPICEWESRRLWSWKNRHKINTYQREWRRKHPEWVREYRQRWMAKWGSAAWYDDRGQEAVRPTPSPGPGHWEMSTHSDVIRWLQ